MRLTVQQMIEELQHLPKDELTNIHKPEECKFCHSKIMYPESFRLKKWYCPDCGAEYYHESSDSFWVEGELS